MASADGTHLFGHQKRLPNQPQLYEIQLDLDHDDNGIHPAVTSHITTASIMADATHAALGTDRAAAVYEGQELGPHLMGQPEHKSARAARFSLLAPEYSSDMPIINKACYGMLLMLVACARPTALSIRKMLQLSVGWHRTDLHL